MDSRYGPNWPTLRRAALERDGRKCFYCGDTYRLQVHHIRPLTRGGANKLFNLVTLCRDCHLGEHADIRVHGLATIPGPSYEAHRFELTDQANVIAYSFYLDKRGLDGSVLRQLEGYA